jgi:hypothetical protein
VDDAGIRVRTAARVVQNSEFCASLWDPFCKPKTKPLGSQRLAKRRERAPRAKLSNPREIKAFCTARAKSPRKTGGDFPNFSESSPQNGTGTIRRGWSPSPQVPTFLAYF